MLRSFAIKELRETYLIALCRVGGLCLLPGGCDEVSALAVLLGRLLCYPVLGDSLSGAFAIVSGGLAIALGLRNRRGIRSEHVPLSPAPARPPVAIAWRKACRRSRDLSGRAAIPVLLYAWWAATPGTHASPFECR